MSRKSLLAAALAVCIAALSLPGAAEAGHRRYRHNNNNDAAAAAVIGLGLGVIVGSTIAQPRYEPRYQSRSYYRESPRYYREPVRYERMQPWSGAWYRYCADRYRSFNPRTGYFLGYDGDYHFCR